MALPARKPVETFTYGDYLTWPDEKRWELIDGVPVCVTPSPSRQHQEVSREFLVALAQFLKGKRCKVYGAPFDVRLPQAGERDEDVRTVLQPDIVVVCDKRKLDDRGCRGAPDLVVEILSRESASRDMKDKLAIYERHKIREYWIIDPLQQLVWVYRLAHDGRYRRPDVFARGDTARSIVLRGFTVAVADIVPR